MSGRLAYSPARPEPNLTQSCQQILPPRPSGGIILTGSDRYECFGPLQQLQALHPSNGRGGHRNGVVSFGERDPYGPKPWREWTADVAEAAHIAEAKIGRGEVTDFYVSHQAFRNWRSITQLSALGSCYVDIDFRTRATWNGRSPRDVLLAILETLDDDGIPLPSYALDTGRGLNLVWLHGLVPRAALSRWSAVQKRLADALKPFGADMRALDAARVFRVTGSINGRAEWDRRTVGMIWCRSDPSNPYRYTFDDLADEVLPLTRTELVSLRSERAKRRDMKEMKVARPKRALSQADWGEALLADLQRLKDHRSPEGTLSEGQRDTWLFCAAVATAWICPPSVLEREIESLAQEAAGWSDRETASRMSSIFKRARDSAAGGKISFNGRDIDPRYIMKSNTIIEWLEIDPTEQRAAKLRMLVDSDRRRELNTERTRLSRQRRGATPHGQSKADRLSMGGQALYMAAKQGMTVRDLADHFGCSTGHISKAMWEARNKTGD